MKVNIKAAAILCLLYFSPSPAGRPTTETLLCPDSIPTYGIEAGVHYIVDELHADRTYEQIRASLTKYDVNGDGFVCIKSLPNGDPKGFVANTIDNSAHNI